jgi:ring-1,2-phenylacetyl-CoA epoxidase subunit PaaC
MSEHRGEPQRARSGANGGTASAPEDLLTVDVAEYAIRLGDDALILSQRLSEWSARSPQIEEDIALMNIALDLLGQARALLSYGGSHTGRSEDELAYLREERQFYNVQLAELDNGDFATTLVRQLLFSAYQYQLYRALEASTDSQLAAIAAKAIKEVSYHLEHAATWVCRLGDGTEFSHDLTQAAVDEVWPYTHDLFCDDPVFERVAAAGVGPLPSSLREPWQATVLPTLAEATLTVPADGWQPSGGRRGLHTQSFGYLLAELQHLHRSHPGAQW